MDVASLSFGRSASDTNSSRSSLCTSTLPTGKSRLILASAWQKIKRLLGISRSTNFDKKLDVCIIVGNDEIRRTAYVLFDTQCQKDVISTRFLRNYPGVKYTKSSQEVGSTLKGEEINAIGKIKIRWHCWQRQRNVLRAPSFNRTRFETSTCYVVDTDKIDVIIGWETIMRLGLLKPHRRLVGAFRPLAPQMNAQEVKQAQTNADKDREQVRQEQRKREKEKNERERRKKAAQSMPNG